ncbi:MAG: methionyl-tRNA formyltransferase [Candidatus Levybacteria bacterium]|nr:methionyl-tRNA formyltransferase [Candidatus Levybacteria bacterium]
MIKLIFFGAGPYVIPIIETLRENFNLSLVVTTEKKPTDAVPSYCLRNKIPYITISSFSDPNWKLEIKNWKFDIAVLAYFGLILPKSILELFPLGILNVHPSLLPKYRGPTPGQTAILNGDKETGVTIIKLDEEVDHGPILAQTIKPIPPNYTTPQLYTELFDDGAGLLAAHIDNYLKGKIKLEPQDHKKATFTPTLTRGDGFIDLENPPSTEKLDRMIRAYYPWPGVWSRISLRTDLKKSQKINTNEGPSLKSKSIIKFLPEKMIQVEGKKPMSYKDFINGYPNAKLIFNLKF